MKMSRTAGFEEICSADSRPPGQKDSSPAAITKHISRSISRATLLYNHLHNFFFEKKFFIFILYDGGRVITGNNESKVDSVGKW